MGTALGRGTNICTLFNMYIYIGPLIQHAHILIDSEYSLVSRDILYGYILLGNVSIVSVGDCRRNNDQGTEALKKCAKPRKEPRAPWSELLSY